MAESIEWASQNQLPLRLLRQSKYCPSCRSACRSRFGLDLVNLTNEEDAPSRQAAAAYYRNTSVCNQSTCTFRNPTRDLWQHIRFGVSNC